MSWHANRLPAVVVNGPETFSDVLILSSGDTGWVCEIDGQRILVARLQIEPGTVMPHEGTRGPVTIARYAVPDIRAQMEVASR